ncbi:hypothetical protein GCM10009677_63130 [Sphaerisporangium rubeum]|uniref:Uncharacterized protein n=1 Tax=Sphaerisporangium rubeum TaxID=321317 RepID=A0A7X0M698_9ACTN|nr:hypothetical protein [Sphaerisporangium rubeum]MBB6471636.1 hypothetical protein [Sphaerisporangium rubeum]
MTRWTLIPLACAVLALSSCAAGAATPAASPAEVLLDPAKVPGGPWRATVTDSVRWSALDEAFIPCGKRVIAPEQATVRLRLFTSAGGASLHELVVSGVDPVQAFKRFYAECGAVGKVSSEPGPQHVARHDGKVEIASYTERFLVVVSAPDTIEDLSAVADAATAQASEGD